MFKNKNSCRGLLTGRFKKGDTKPPEGSRMELATKLKIPFDNFPDIDKYLHDEKFWNLMDVMEKVAKKHGNYLCTHTEGGERKSDALFSGRTQTVLSRRQSRSCKICVQDIKFTSILMYINFYTI